MKMTEAELLLFEALNFLVLAGVLVWLAKKYGRPILAARSKEIGEGLAAGEKAKADADARAAEVQAKLAKLETEVAALRTVAKEEREREAARIRQETETEIARIHTRAEDEIESAGKHALMEVRHAAARMAIELAETKVRARMSPQIEATLLQGFLADLPLNGAARLG
jgi:F-type H+-transporting ATPase subunit b